MPVPNLIELSTLRILNPQGQTIGTGFLVSRNLVATCAHVVVSIGMNAENCIQVQFTGEKERLRARVLEEFLDYEQDVSILEIETAPKGVNPLRLGPAAECRSRNEFRSYGYATAADVQGIYANGRIDGYLNEHKLLQLQSAQANHGISGAPVLDEKRGIVVGMITKGHTELGRNELTTFATPSETLWQVCPQLKPSIPPLPHRNPIVEGINLLPYDYDQGIQNFLTEYLGTEAHPVPFGGRDEALKMLDAWLTETVPYFLLVAPAGRGKSALLVRWLDSLKERDDLSLAFMPVSIRFGTNMERVFYAALAARLAFLHGDDIPTSPETSTAIYRGLVNDYLSKPLANGRTLLVVLDGLDEAADWQAGADFLPSVLPAEVRVVVSARFLAGDADSAPWLRRLNWERMELASTLSLTPLDHDGVRDVLLKMGNPLEDLSHKIDVVEKLHYLSQGDPLLVGLYVDNLRKKGKGASQLQPEELERIEPGYKGYFNDYWWKVQEESWGDNTPLMRPHVQMVLNILSGALGPLSRTEIMSLAPQELNKYALDNALKALRRFVIGDGVKQGYIFAHPKLGEYFWDGLSQPEQEEVENRFLGWCEAIFQEFISGKRDPKKKDHIPVYVVCNYSAHLARAEQPIEKWLLLIHHHEWAQAWFTLEGAYGGYLQDVQRVWELCKIFDWQAVQRLEIPLYLDMQIRCALITSSICSLVINISPTMLKKLVECEIWTSKQALIYIRQMKDSKQKAEALMHLIPLLPDLMIVEDGFKLAQSINNQTDRIDVVCMIIKYLPEATINQLILESDELSEDNRSFLFATIIRHHPMVNFKLLISKTELIKDSGYEIRVLEALAKYAPTNLLSVVFAMMKEAQQRTMQIHMILNCEEVLDNLVRRLPYNDIKEILSELLLSSQYMFIKKVFHTSGELIPKSKFGELLILVREIENFEVRTDLLIIAAQYLPEISHEAYTLAMQIEDKESRFHALCKLFPFVDEAASEALCLVREIIYENPSSNVLYLLIDNIPQVLCNEVIAIVKTIKDYKRQASLMVKLVEKSPDLLGTALQTTRKIRSKYDHAHLLNALVKFSPEIADEALLTSKSIRNLWDRIFNLIELAKFHSDAWKDVISEVRSITDIVQRVEILVDIADDFPEASDEALQVIESLPTEFKRVETLKKLAPKLKPYQLIHGLEIARKIDDNIARSYILLELSRGQTDIVREAFIASQYNNDYYEQVSLFIDLVDYLPDIWASILNTSKLILMDVQRMGVLAEIISFIPDEYMNVVLTLVSEFDNRGYRLGLAHAISWRMPGLVPKSMLSRNRFNKQETFDANMAAFVSAGYAKSSSKNRLATKIDNMDQKSIWILNYLLSDNSSRDLLLRTLKAYILPFLPQKEKAAVGIYAAVRDVTTWWP